MKATWYILFVMVCIQCFAGILIDLGVEGVPMQAWNETDVEDKMNATMLVDSWTWEEQGLYGDVIAGLLFFWNSNLPIIEGFTSMLQNFGTPDYIVNMIKIPYRFLWVSFIVAFISGRNING